MEIEITPNGGVKRVPLEIGENIEEHTSEIEHEDVKNFIPKNTKISDIDFEFEENGDIKSIKLHIPEMITIEISDGRLNEFNIDVPNIQVNHANIENKDAENDGEEKHNTSGRDLPPIPQIEHVSISDEYLKRYKSLDSEGTQPYLIRKIIFEEGEITRGELKKRLHEYGYNSIEIGKSHTGVNSTLRVLDDFTNEIERNGRGENKTLRWISS